MKSITLILLILFVCVDAKSQTFNSGSTGADGAFNPPSSMPTGTTVQGNCTNGSPCVVTIPLREPAPGQPIHANGPHVFNFTTVNISSNVTVKFLRNVANTPVFILAQGDVTISGVIDVSGTAASGGLSIGKGGPGGFDGGGGARLGAPTNIGGSGSGPGGGGPSTAGSFATGTPTLLYGSAELETIIGGSGGGGSGRPPMAGFPGLLGGGGGGAILIASSGVIDLGSGSAIVIRASGGNGATGIGSGKAGAGSGGAIRLIATLLRGTRPMDASGGRNTPVSTVDLSTGPIGRIRIETTQPLQYTGTTTPQASVLVNGDPFFGTPIRVFPPVTPSLRIVSIGGVTLPAQPTADVLTPDIGLAANFTNPVAIVVEGTNVPGGTPFEVLASPQFGSGDRVIAQGVLTGPAGQKKMATVSVQLPPTGVGIISAVIRTAIVPEPETSQIH